MLLLVFGYIINRKSALSHDSATLPIVIKEKDVEYQVMHVLCNGPCMYVTAYHFSRLVSPSSSVQSTTTGVYHVVNVYHMSESMHNVHTYVCTYIHAYI